LDVWAFLCPPPLEESLKKIKEMAASEINMNIAIA